MFFIVCLNLPTRYKIRKIIFQLFMTKRVSDTTSSNTAKRHKPAELEPWGDIKQTTLFKSITEPADPAVLQQLKYAFNDHANQPSKKTVQVIHDLFQHLWPQSPYPELLLKKTQHTDTTRVNTGWLTGQDKLAAAQNPCLDQGLSINNSPSLTIGTPNTQKPYSSLSYELIQLIQTLVGKTIFRNKAMPSQVSKTPVQTETPNAYSTSTPPSSTTTASRLVAGYIRQGMIVGKDILPTRVLPPTDVKLSLYSGVDRLKFFGYYPKAQLNSNGLDNVVDDNRNCDRSDQPQTAKKPDQTPETIIKQPSRSPSLLSLLSLTPPMPEPPSQQDQKVPEAALNLYFFANSPRP